MTKKQSLLFRFLLFFAGAGIIVLAFSLFKGERELTKTDSFVWTSIGLMYLVFFTPFFFTAIKIGNFSNKIPSLSLVWLGILLYVGASIAVILLLVVAYVISIKLAVILQAVLLFLFLIDIYFAYLASSHVRSVAAEEASKQQYIKQLKLKAQVLTLFADKLPAEYEKSQKILKQAIEDIRYMYPVDGGAGADLELQILQSLNIISELSGSIQVGSYTISLEREVEKLRMLVKERKLIRN